jgi:hypothetical protein
MFDHPLGHGAEEAGKPQVGDRDHHADQEDDGVVNRWPRTPG